MQEDPRDSVDSLVRQTLDVWDRVGESHDKAYEEAQQIRESLLTTDHHQALGWATAICGRIDAYRGFHLRADAFLTEAYGRLFLGNDRYGLQMVTLHLAIPRIGLGDLNRALELVLQPLQSDVRFRNSDQCLIHSVAALCYVERQEFHGALFQINKEYELVRQSGDSDRVSIVLGNIASILLSIGAWDPAGRAASQAWELQLQSSSNRQRMQLAILANAVHAHTLLGRLDTAREYANQLVAYLEEEELPVHALMHVHLALFFSREGNLKSAKRHFNRALALAQGSDHARALDTARTLLLECGGAYVEAINTARSVLDLPSNEFLLGFRIVLAGALQRCHNALGNEVEAHKWRQFENELSRSVLLSDLFANQFPPIPTKSQLKSPLTERELTCLRLSAHGQTSADIGLKLGLKTRTVNFHFGNILRKLNAMNRQEAIAKAVSSNLLKRD